MKGVGEPPREWQVVASRMDLEDVSGRVLFPTPRVGPWVPFVRFAETVTTGHDDDSEGHSHKGEEVLNYIVEGRVDYEDDVGRRTVLDRGAVVLLTAREEAHHNVRANPAPRSRWLSVIVRVPPVAGGVPHAVQVATAAVPPRSGGGAIERPLVGRGAPVVSAAGLECVDLEFPDAGRCICPVGKGRRAVAYAYEGSASIDGHLVEAGAGALLEGVDEVAVQATSGSRVILASAPRPVD